MLLFTTEKRNGSNKLRWRIEMPTKPNKPCNFPGEAGEAVKDSKRIIADSPISDILSGALGAGIGGTIFFAALYTLGTVGLSAAGITSGLATAGSIIGGGMVAGIFTLAAPIAVLGAGGVAISINIKKKKLKEEKERLYFEALRKQDAVIKAMKETLVVPVT